MDEAGAVRAVAARPLTEATVPDALRALLAGEHRTPPVRGSEADW
jgi:hypothetical protein